MAYVILGLWGMWIIFNVMIVFFAHRCIFTNTPDTIASASGLFWNSSIVLNPGVSSILTGDEVCAIFAHEQGHIYRHHILENLLVVCFIPFMIPFRWTRRRYQEFEADDYAAEIVGIAAIASAIRKLSNHDFDIIRAKRLEARLKARMRHNIPNPS